MKENRRRAERFRCLKNHIQFIVIYKRKLHDFLARYIPERDAEVYGAASYGAVSPCPAPFHIYKQPQRKGLLESNASEFGEFGSSLDEKSFLSQGCAQNGRFSSLPSLGFLGITKITKGAHKGASVFIHKFGKEMNCSLRTSNLIFHIHLPHSK